MLISINGKFVKQIVLQGSEPEFHYGYGVFETIRTYQQQPFEVAAHLRRLRQSAKSIHLKIKPDNEILNLWILAHCSAKPESRIKVIAAPHKIYILSTPLTIPKTIYTQGVTVTTYPASRIQSSVKGNAWVQEYLAYQYAIQRHYFDALLVNNQQQVPEAACGNIFYIRRKQLYTTNSHMLHGITRAVTLKLAKRIVPIHYRLPKLADLVNADECFVTKTTSGIVPIVKINRRKIGSGQPGSYTKTLIELFDEYTKR